MYCAGIVSVHKMRLSKFILAAVLITSLSLFYVCQQTEIIRLAYIGQKKLCMFQESLDKNSMLRYNLKRKTSLINIGNRISNSDDFYMPGTYCIVKLAPSKQNGGFANRKADKKISLVSLIFGIKRQAQAQTLDNKSPFLSADRR